MPSKKDYYLQFIEGLNAARVRFSGSLTIERLSATDVRVDLVEPEIGRLLVSVTLHLTEHNVSWSCQNDPAFSEWFANTVAAVAGRATGHPFTTASATESGNAADFDKRFPSFITWLIKTGISHGPKHALASPRSAAAGRNLFQAACMA